jgi:prophage regulatory protein
MTPNPSIPRRLLALRDVITLTAMSRSAIYRDMAAGTFPRCTKVGSRARWAEHEVAAWIDRQLESRNPATKEPT